MAEQVSSSVIGKVVDSLFGVIKKETGYMWNCTQHVEKFKNEVEKLKDMKGRVQQQVDIAKSEGNNLIVGVERWVEEAGQEISKAEEFLEQEANAKKTCFKIGMCGNWATLHHYGKITATNMVPTLLEHQERGKDFVTCVSVYTRPPGPLDVYENKELDDLVTQNSALNDIITALEDDNIQIIGIYGLGGVGKTTLAKEVVAKVKHLFADVAFTTVSQTVKAQEIKKDIENATKRVVKGEKVLIIFDDIWEKLNLEELCIPIKHKSCKILLTSRSERVCQKMNVQSKICVNSLTAKEAWILFRRVVGEKVETDANLKLVAEEVAKECGGLPLLIQVVGNALKDESIKSWKAALSRLKKAAPSEIDPDIEKAFTRLQLSYEYLKSEEAKSCFLICSMFPEDYVIPLERLVYYMVGLHKFDDLESMEDARDRVRNAVNMLTSSCLLLNVQFGESFTKMHDVVRDVALLIASQGNNKYLVKAGKGLTEWQPINNSLESYTGISLMENRISKLPDYGVHLSTLEIFLLDNNPDLTIISDEFIKGMKEVKVLDLSGCPKTQLPQSLELLTKLRMLNLTGNKSLHEITILREMKELEILILNRTAIEKIPKEIGRLMNLRRLEVKGCVDLSCITHGVISGLWRLEELCIEFKLNFKGVSDCIVEIMSLSKLTYLDLTVPNIEDIPPQGQGFNSEKLKEFVIQIGEYNRYAPTSRSVSWSGRCLVLSRVNLRNSLVKRLKKLIEGSSPKTILYGIKNLNNMMPTMYDEGFNKLERIDLDNCSNVSCLVDDGARCDGDEGKTGEKFFTELKHLALLNLNNLEMLWKCPDEYISLTHLVTLEIWYCQKLERVFTVSVAEGLVNLKYLTVLGCDRLEEVIWGGDGGVDESRNVIVFRSLTNIELYNLSRLKRFFNSVGNCSIKYPSLEIVKIDNCESMEIWGPQIHETPNLEEKFFKDLKSLKLSYLNKLEVLWKCPDEYISLSNLVTLRIKGCDKLKRVFTVSVAQGLFNLKKLEIEYCFCLEEVIYGGGGDDESGSVIVFLSLATISFNGLPKLKRFFNSTAGNCRIEYPSLVEVEISCCKSMEKWGAGIHETPKLKTLVVNPIYGNERRLQLDGANAINDAVTKGQEKENTN